VRQQYENGEESNCGKRWQEVLMEQRVKLQSQRCALRLCRLLEESAPLDVCKAEDSATGPWHMAYLALQPLWPASSSLQKRSKPLLRDTLDSQLLRALHLGLLCQA